MTPLLCCVRKGYLELAKFLLGKGADKTSSDKYVIFIIIESQSIYYFYGFYIL